jgi:hypothetical protein
MCSSAEVFEYVVYSFLLARVCECNASDETLVSVERVFLLALDHARARVSEHACEEQCVFVLKLLKKLCACSHLCKCTSVQSYDLISMLPSTRADILACVRAYHCT